MYMSVHARATAPGNVAAAVAGSVALVAPKVVAPDVVLVVTIGVATKHTYLVGGAGARVLVPSGLRNCREESHNVGAG